MSSFRLCYVCGKYHGAAGLHNSSFDTDSVSQLSHIIS
jgi:hypothetical protein